MQNTYIQRLIPKLKQRQKFSKQNLKEIPQGKHTKTR